MRREQGNAEIKSQKELTSLPEPVTSKAIQVRQCVSSKRWENIVSDAIEKAEIVCEVEAEMKRTGDSRRKCHRRVASETIWSSYLHWWRRWKGEEGPEWERLLDRRVPPYTITVVSPEVRTAVVALRQAAVYDELGAYQKGLEYYEKSQKIEEEIGDKRGEAVSLHNIGACFGIWCLRFSEIGTSDHISRPMLRGLDFGKTGNDR